jgi:site-specific DNA-cytosine methylase
MLSGSEMVAIDLFSGAGGMSLGARMAGVNIVLAVDADSHSAETYSFKFPETTVINRKFDTRQELSRSRKERRLNRVWWTTMSGVLCFESADKVEEEQGELVVLRIRKNCGSATSGMGGI